MPQSNALIHQRVREAEAFLLSACIAIVGVALALVRTRVEPALPDVPYLASSRISLAAWVPIAPPPAPRPKPATPAPHPAPATPVFELAGSPLSREQGIKVVLSTAHSLVGRPYRYGAAGPDAFDCSGFTSFVWRTAGLRLPHSSGQQYNSLPRVPIEALQPGDLVFSGSRGVHHVGLYIGGGQTINAVHSGRSVEVQPVRRNLIGATRPALLLRPGTQ
jgi:cell wall-associated NlpC family hydrolase